ncbi:MAG: 1-acyl-sn-glycerol-3-phosphate acyltransferase [Rhodospirillum sp.]|nr:1-acyl-sn-glycerol-3-phosphate acyltransferase [Rhodospirillum sp.]MCF8490618.1 1-acyl-sn-glycerol-3-phosphate acyltransferase [Rhodospirillum sp.]MCF8498935.1 1-acyl-sn-glycerol-3-phosphate acyltransferase [Rhodospirillum sp.]
MGHAAYRGVRGRLGHADLTAGSACLVRALERMGVRFEVTGLDVTEAHGGPVVFVCNHMSALETQVLPGIIGHERPLTFVIKASLMRYPIFRRVLGAFDPIIVSRTDPRADLAHVLQEGGRKLEAGVSVIIFPQAHRSDGFVAEGFGTLGMRLARRAGVPMVPVALSTRAWSRGRWVEDMGWIDPALPVRFSFGPPIPVGTDPAKAHRDVADYIAARIAEWDASP